MSDEQTKEIMKAAGEMAHVAGQITGEDLNFSRSRNELGVSVGELAFLLPNLKKAVAEYNRLIIEAHEEIKR